MIPRLASETLRRLAKGFPIVALTGPRQSRKFKEVNNRSKPFDLFKSPIQ